ncbi:MAG: hypothetical protein AAGJ83_02130, partial [Planctomycetota bacterium]
NNAGLMAASLDEAIAAKKREESDGSDKEDDDVDEMEDADPKDVGRNADSIVSTAWIRDLLRMQGGATESFTNLLPPGVTLTEPVRVANSPEMKSLIVYSRGRMVRLSLDGVDLSASEVAKLEADLLLEDENAAKSLLSASGTSVLLFRQSEPLQWLDGSDFSLLAELEIESNETLIAIRGLDTDRFVMLNADGELWLTTREDKVIRRTLLSFSDVTGIEYLPDEQLLAVAHHLDRIDIVKVANDGSTEAIREIRPNVSGWRSVDRYIITPLRTLTPQTGELSDTVAALVGGKSSFALGQGQPDEQEVIQLEIARPVLSCGAFVVVMLVLSCVYFKRRDF